LTPYNFGYESIACGRNPSGTGEGDRTGIVLIDIRKRSLEVLNKFKKNYSSSRVRMLGAGMGKI
jgi:hypothetical protein